MYFISYTCSTNLYADNFLLPQTNIKLCVHNYRKLTFLCLLVILWHQLSHFIEVT